MTSQISTRKFLMQEIRQNGWMFGLSGLLHLLTGPVTFLLNTSNSKNWSESALASRYQRYASDNFFIWQILTIAGCLMISIFVYRYLFSRRMVDLYHSVPVSRKQLFTVKYLHGLFVWLLPFLFNAGSVMLLYIIRIAGKPFFGSVIKELLVSIILLIFCYLIFYHLFLTAVYLSGNVLNMMTNALILGCTTICMGLALLSCADNFFDSFCYTTPEYINDIFYALSPAVSPFMIYAFLPSDNLADHILLIILSILICLGLLLASRMLCLKRPSELAERGTDRRIYSITSKISTSFIVGIAGALFFSSICAQDQQLAWGIFGGLLCSVVTFGALNSIYKTTIKAFFRQPIQLLLSAAASVLVVVTFQLDLLGYDTFLPDKSSIAGMAIYSNQFTDGSSYISALGERYNPYKVTQETLLTDQDSSYELLDILVNNEVTGGYTSVYAKISLTNGRTYERFYKLADENYLFLKPFIESDDYIANNYKYSTLALGYPKKLTLEMLNTGIEISKQKTDLSDTIIKSIMDAYRTDFLEHFSLEKQASQMIAFSFSGNYGDSNANEYNYFSLEVPEDYSRTIKVIQDLYPEHTLRITSAEDITDLYMNINYFNKFEADDFSLDTLYEYFGYGSSAALEETVEEIQTTDTPQVEIVEIASADGKPVPVTKEYYGELTINDSKTLADLYPLLHFGHYRDIFDKKEYIYIGYVRTTKGNSIDCYVRPATMPEDIIKLLYDSIEAYEY